MKLLSPSDLQTRWGYTRAGVHRLAKAADFPMPFALVSNNRVKLFREADIVTYEQDKPWLFDENQKRQRQRLFGLLKQARENPEQREAILKHAFGEDAKNWISD